MCILFKYLFVAVQTSDPDWFALVASSVNEEMTLKLQNLFLTADQRRAAQG